MAMKPRTFRRVVLLGSLGAIVLLAVFGYFVARPWQNQRQLKSMRTDGLAAYEAKDYPEAITTLGRYVRNAEEPEAEVILAYARARLKVQASDGGHIRVAVRSYRDYLNRVPDDVEASRELLPLFNLLGMHVEAISLAQDLRERYQNDSIEILREERIARGSLGERDEVIEPLIVAAVEHEDAGFNDMLVYASWFSGRGKGDEVRAHFEKLLDEEPDSLANRIIRYWLSIPDLGQGEPGQIAELTEELSGILGLDPQTGSWDKEPGRLEPGLVLFVDRLFNSFRRPDLSLEVRVKAASREQDPMSAVWAARRLFWTGDDERLLSLDVASEEGEPLPDVIGYQILSKLRADDGGGLEELRARLDSIELSFRGIAWRSLIDGKMLMEDGQMVEARPAVANALEVYPTEPTFHLTMGDLHMAQGRLGLAAEHWERADQLANGGNYDEGQVGVVGWIDPMVKLIDGYTRANRLVEAIDYLPRLGQIAPDSPITHSIWLQAYVSLARQSALPSEDARKLLTSYESLRERFTPEELARYAAQYAAMYAYVGEFDEARSVIQTALATSPEQRILFELLDVDQRYQLGIAQAAGLDAGEIALASPSGALRYALNIYRQSGEVEQGLAVIEDGIARQDGPDAYQWELTRARYLDATEDKRALEAWEKLRAQHPDNIELLYEIAESNAYMADLAKVDQIINEIIEKTATAGQTAPTRLRLARASAIVHNERTNTTRQRALEIVRAVVASEPRNIKARNMLGRLLEMRPDPGLPPEERFERDYNGAISQYATISRQINGRGAQVYLLQAADLSFENNDPQSARQYLQEFNTRFPDDYTNLPLVAQRFENLNMPDEAAEIWTKIIRNSGSRELFVRAGLELADLYLTSGRQAQAQALLSDLRGIEELDADELLRLASLHSRYGYKAEGEQLAGSGERYGLSTSEARIVYARYASEFISGEEYIKVLREVVASDPQNADAWKQLIQRLVREQRYEEAQEKLSSAREKLGESEDLRALEILARGVPRSASVLLESGAIESSPQLVEAVQRVDEYSALDNNTDLDTRVTLLTELIRDFPEIGPVQNFAIGQLSLLPINPRLLAEYADRAARRFPGSDVVMRTAGNAYLRASLPADAHRIAQLWRSNSPGTTTEPDAISARAMIQLGNHSESIRLLQPHVLSAIKSPDLLISQDVLQAYSHSMLMQGEDPDATADRLRPLLAANENIRMRVWLTLAVGSVPDHDDGAQWIRELDGYAGESEQGMIAEGWVSLAERHGAWVPEYGRHAIEIMESSTAQDSITPMDLVLLARAYTVLARGASPVDERTAHYAKAISLLEQADEISPTNISFLMQAAQYATESGQYSVGEKLYRTLLERDLPANELRASVLNNLAMTILRQTDDDAKLSDALGFIKDALELANRSTFWGTRGWVELAMGDPAAAEASFLRATELTDSDLEGWVGLAVSRHQQGPERAADADGAFRRVLQLAESPGLNEEFRGILREQGAQRWQSDLGS